MCQVQIYGIIPNNDNFGLDVLFQENFYIDDGSVNVPVLLGYDETSGCLCREIPKKLTICFGRSECFSMPHKFNITTPGLKLTTTHIVELGPKDFEQMYHLQNLQIEGNLNLSNILPGTFNSNFTNLKNLSISYNPQLRSLHPKTFEDLKNLSHLFLVKNGFRSLTDITFAVGPHFLPNLIKLSLCQNNFIKVNSEDFVPMTNSTMQELTLVLCRLESVDPGAFVPLNNLQALRLGENRFDVPTIIHVVENIAQHNLPLKLLNLYAAGLRNNIPMDLMQAIAKTNISYLNLAKNQFESINANSFPLMPKIEALDLREVLALDVSPNAFANLPNLKTLLLSGNNLPYIPQGALVPTLRNLDLQQNAAQRFGPSYFFVCNACFSKMTNLLYLNFNFNNILHLYKESFTGLSQLRVLGLKNASIYHIQNFTFHSQKKLVFLNLENNDFVRRNDPFGIWPDMFSGLGNLKVLLLGGCSISYFSLYGNQFIHLKNLVHLGLQMNELTTISSKDFEPLKKLQSIDLSDNWLKAWDERIFLHNQMLSIGFFHHNKLIHITEAMYDDFYKLSRLELEFNAFTCNCYTYRYFSKWSKRHRNNSMIEKLDRKANCLSPLQFSNYTVPGFLMSVQNNSIICYIEKKTTIVIMLPLILLLLFFAALSGFVYFYRWHIKYWIFMTRLYLGRRGRLNSKKKVICANNYMYDGFVSYSTEDRNFVVRLASMLENYEPHVKLCIYERDFQIGSILSESILEGVAKSRKTLLIISDNYAKSQWCRWESHLAEHHRLFFENEEGEYVDDTLILVKLGPVNNNHLTPMLRYLLKTRIYLQWEADEKKQKIFWEKLRNSLASPNFQNAIIESTHI